MKDRIVFIFALLFVWLNPKTGHRIIVSSFVIQSKASSSASSRKPIRNTVHSSTSNNNDYNDQAAEAVKSLMQYHEGKWKGVAKSWTVVPDTAAGIMQRRVSPEYETSIRLGLDATKQFALQETFNWKTTDQDTGEKKMMVASRSLPIQNCNMDVDAVDASYSLDTSLPDFPSALSGSSKICQFLIEHCIAASDDRRLRCFVMYGVDQSLQRIVVCDETKVQDDPSKNISDGASFTAADLLEMQSDVDRLVDKLTGGMETTTSTTGESSSSSISSPTPPKTVDVDLSDTTADAPSRTTQSTPPASQDDGSKLTLHDISLLELSSGVWLGDAIIRDDQTVKGSPTEGLKGKGFGESPRSSSSSSSSSRPTTSEFGDWDVGVQKIAWRWMWNFGEEIRQIIDVGKAMGAQLAPALTGSLAGRVCVNEGLKRRIPKEERMVYIDYSSNDLVSFLSGPNSITVPRFLNFKPESTVTRKNNAKPFVTEFYVFQRPDEEGNDKNSGGGAEEAATELPELLVSKISRVYNFEGRMKQGCTSFYTFKRFGSDGEIEED